MKASLLDCRWFLAVLIGALVLGIGATAQAADYTWTNGAATAIFTNAGNFNPTPTSPFTGDDRVYYATNGARALTFDSNLVLSNLFFNHTANTATLKVNSGNTLTLLDSLVAGQNPGATSTVLKDLTGTLAVTNANASANLVVGGSGAGTLTFSVGKIIADQIILGQSSSGNGTFSQGATGTRLTVSNMVVGQSSVGSYTLGNTATNNVSALLVIGQNAGSTGTVTVSAGQLTVTNTAASAQLVVGQGGKGTLTLSGGSVIADSFVVATNAGSVGTFTWSGGSLQVGNVNGIAVNTSDPATIITNLLGTSWGKQTSQTFGMGTNLALSFPSGLVLGETAAGTGAVNQTAGTLAFTNGSGNAQLIVGQGGGGAYTLNGGSLLANQLLVTNNSATATNSFFTFTSGTLTTSNAADQIAANLQLAGQPTVWTIANSFAIGGTWNMLGGTNIIDFVGSPGTIQLPNGTVNVKPGATLVIGTNVSQVLFGQNGGILNIGGAGATACVTSPVTLNIGRSGAGSVNCRITITNGTLFARVTIPNASGGSDNSIVVNQDATWNQLGRDLSISGRSDQLRDSVLVNGGCVTNVGAITMSGNYGLLAVSNGGSLFASSVTVGKNGDTMNNFNVFNVGGEGLRSTVRLSGGLSLGEAPNANSRAPSANTVNITNADFYCAGAIVGNDNCNPSSSGASYQWNNQVNVLTGAYWNAGAGNITVGIGSRTNVVTTNNTLFVNSGIVTNAGALTVGNNAYAHFNSLTITNGGQVFAASLAVGNNNTGNTVTVNSGSLSVGSLTMNSGTSNALTFSGGLLRMQTASVTNGLPFVVGDGTQAAELNLTGGTNRTLTFTDGLVISNNAVLTGSGKIASPTTIHGTLAPGNGTTVTAMLFTAGLTFTNSGTLRLTLAGTGKGQSDCVYAPGQTLDVQNGRLEVVLLGGFTPQSSDVLTNAIVGTLLGSFNNLAGDRVIVSPGMAFKVSMTGGTLVLSKYGPYSIGTLFLFR